MAERFLEPNVPLKKINNETGDIDYIYPQTTASQVIMSEDGERLNTILTENILYLDDTDEGGVETINADTLGGKTYSDIVNLIYPVGSVYMSVNETSPATLFGGTWVKIENRFLVAAGSSYTAGGTGGAASVSYTPKGTNAGTAITAAQMPKHRHVVKLWNNAGTKANAKTTSNYGAGTTDATSGLMGTWGSWQTSTFQVAQSGYGDQAGLSDVAGNGATHTHTFTGTAATINTVPPYYAVYMWRRTA